MTNISQRADFVITISKHWLIYLKKTIYTMYEHFMGYIYQLIITVYNIYKQIV